MERKTRTAKIGNRPGKFTILKNCKVCSKKLSVSEPCELLVVFHPEITSLIRMVYRKLSASSSEVKGNFPSMDCSDLCSTKVLAKSLIDSILKIEPSCFNLVEKLSEKISSVNSNLLSNEQRQCGLCDLSFNSTSKTIEHLTFHHPKYLALVIFLQFRPLSELNGCNNQISVNQKTSEILSQRIANSHILGSRQPVIIVEKLPDNLYRKCMAKGCVKVKVVTKYNLRRQKKKEKALLKQIIAKKLLNKQHEKEARKEAVYWQKGLTAYVKKSGIWQLDVQLLDARKILKTRDGYESLLEFVNSYLLSGRVKDTVKYYLDKIFKANEKVQILLTEADNLDQPLLQNIIHDKTCTSEPDNEVTKKRKRVHSVSSNNDFESDTINKNVLKKHSKPIILDTSFKKETNVSLSSELQMHSSPEAKEKTACSSLTTKEYFTLNEKNKEKLDCISYLKPVEKPKVLENKFLRNAREHLKAKKMALKKKVPSVNSSPEDNCSEEEIKMRHHHRRCSTPKVRSDVKQLKGNTIDLNVNSSLVPEDKQIIECFCGKPDCEGLHPEIFTF